MNVPHSVCETLFCRKLICCVLPLFIFAFHLVISGDWEVYRLSLLNSVRLLKQTCWQSFITVTEIISHDGWRIVVVVAVLSIIETEDTLTLHTVVIIINRRH